MSELKVELFHYGYPLESVRSLLKVIGLNLEAVPESIDELYAALAAAAAKDNEANPEGYDWHVSRRSNWELLVATPSNMLILINLVNVCFRFGCDYAEDHAEISRRLLEISRECGCPAWADGVSV